MDVSTTSRSFCLSWTHYIFLLGVKNPDERSFYEIESANESWTVRELKRQFDSSLYERLALSKPTAIVFLDHRDSNISAARHAWLDSAIADALFPSINDLTQSNNCQMHWLQRPWDQDFYPAARSGFFPFWKKISRAPIFHPQEPQQVFAF